MALFLLAASEGIHGLGDLTTISNSSVLKSKPFANSIAQSIGTGVALFPIRITVAPGQQHEKIDS